MSEDIFFLALVIITGLCLGSFATALSWRLPRGIGIAGKERSACPACHRQLGVIDLVPVLSWIFLRGKCRTCAAAIGWRYPVIELATLALCLIFYFHFGLSLRSIFLFLLAPVIVSTIDIDLRYKIIPDTLNAAIFLIGFFAVFTAGGLVPEGDWLKALGGSLMYGLGFFILRQIVMMILKREPLGWGDIKFFVAAGTWLGPSPDLLAQFMFLAGISGVFLALIWRKVKKEQEFPFGPPLLIALVVTILYQADPYYFYVNQ